jgi:hypothetical protein
MASRLLPTFLICGLLLAGAPAASAAPGTYSGAYTTHVGPDVRGAVLVRPAGADLARVILALDGLAANTEYRLVISKAACGVASTLADRLARLDFQSGAKGGAYRAEVVPWLWSIVALPHSMRLRTRGGDAECWSMTAFRRAAEPTADMQFARFADGSRRGLVFIDGLDGSHARVSWSLSGLRPGAAYRLRAATVGCDVPLAASAVLFGLTLTADADGHANGEVTGVGIPNDAANWVRSVRVARIGGARWACSRGVATDYVE